MIIQSRANGLSEKETVKWDINFTEAKLVKAIVNNEYEKQLKIEKELEEIYKRWSILHGGTARKH